MDSQALLAGQHRVRWGYETLLRGKIEMCVEQEKDTEHRSYQEWSGMDRHALEPDTNE